MAYYDEDYCGQETDMEVRMNLIKMMDRFHVPGMAKELETLWEYGAYEEAVGTERKGRKGHLDMRRRGY